MKKITIYFWVLLGFLSCENYLHKLPLNNPSDQTFLSSETEMKMALVGCYSGLNLKFHNLTFFLPFDYASDIGYDRNTGELQQLGQGIRRS